jgi:hypothetical protein
MSILSQCFMERCLEVEEEYLHQPVTTLKATEGGSDQLSCTPGQERLPVPIPVASEDISQSSQSSQRDRDFHLVDVHNYPRHLNNGPDAHFFQVYPMQWLM